MDRYNKERINQGRCCQALTTIENFIYGLPLYKKYVYEEVEENIAI